MTMEFWAWNSWAVWLLIPVAAITLLYWRLTRNYGHWESKGIKEVRPKFGLGLLLFPNKLQLHELDLETYQKNGRVYGSFEFSQPTLTIADPELLKLIFVKDFHVFRNRRMISVSNPIVKEVLSLLNGEGWKRVRAIISPSFSSGKIRKMAHLVNDCAEVLKENFLKAAKEDVAVDCKSYFGAFTMDTIASCAFGMKINSQVEENQPFVRHGKKLFSPSQNLAVFFLLALFPRLLRIFRINLFPKDSVEFFVNASKHIIQKRKETGERGSDFLQLVMDARQRDEVESDEHEVDETQGHHFIADEVAQVPKKNYRALSENEALAQCFMFFFAGYETTASALSFVAYELAINPHCQEKLHKEVDKVWEKHNGKIDFDVVSSMPYLDAVVSETLRKDPLVIRTERQASEDYELRDTGIVIPKDTIVQIPIYSIQHDPEWYPEPETFNPERFSPENKASIKQYTYLPFGAGPRNCIAARFALMEAKLCLVKVLRYVRFVRSSETKVPPDFNTVQGLLLAKNIMMKIERRETAD